MDQDWHEWLNVGNPRVLAAIIDRELLPGGDPDFAALVWYELANVLAKPDEQLDNDDLTARVELYRSVRHTFRHTFA